VVLDAERTERLGELGLAVLGERWTVALEVRERCADDLATLAARAGHEGHGSPRRRPGREQPARRERLVVGVSVHDEQGAVGQGRLGDHGSPSSAEVLHAPVLRGT